MDINVFMYCVQGHDYHILRKKPVDNDNKTLLIFEVLILSNQHSPPQKGLLDKFTPVEIGTERNY